MLLIKRVDVEEDLMRWKSFFKCGGIAERMSFGECDGSLSISARVMRQLGKGTSEIGHTWMGSYLLSNRGVTKILVRLLRGERKRFHDALKGRRLRCSTRSKAARRFLAAATDFSSNER